MNLPEDHHIGPGGLRHKSAFHRIRQGLHARIPQSGVIERHGDDGEVEVQSVELQAPPEADSQLQPGWIGWAGWTNDTGRALTELAGSYTVPEAPSQETGQTVFLFLGMQKATDDTSELFQPVLQWGESAAGGGQWWGISCWYLKDGMVVFSGLERVSPGDRIHASMRRHVLGDRIRWTARAATAAGDVVSELHVLHELELAWSYAALEAYGPQGMACAMYPASEATTFEGLSLESGEGVVTPSWEPTVLVDDCGQGIDVVSAERVVLRYRADG